MAKNKSKNMTAGEHEVLFSEAYLKRDVESLPNACPSVDICDGDTEQQDCMREQLVVEAWYKRMHKSLR